MNNNEHLSVKNKVVRILAEHFHARNEPIDYTEIDDDHDVASSYLDDIDALPDYQVTRGVRDEESNPQFIIERVEPSIHQLKFYQLTGDIEKSHAEREEDNYDIDKKYMELDKPEFRFAATEEFVALLHSLMCSRDGGYDIEEVEIDEDDVLHHIG